MIPPHTVPNFGPIPPALSRRHPLLKGARQHLFRFPNGYGASVVEYRRGGCEMAAGRVVGPAPDDLSIDSEWPVPGHPDRAGQTISDITPSLSTLAALPRRVGRGQYERRKPASQITF